MNKKEKLALFLGMLSGDGCLPLQHSGQGYRDYAVRFCNTNKGIVNLFGDLFFKLFGGHGKIRVTRRKDRKDLYEFCKYSKKIVNDLINLGFPEGVKRDILRVPKIINKGTKRERLYFIYGFLITDGCIRKNKTIIFHLGSKLFLQDLTKLINYSIKSNLKIKEYTQKGKYESYQLNLYKEDAARLLRNMPTWHNGTALALSLQFLLEKETLGR